ncbi:hypothetical protein N9131_00055 [bacterium]|nr:hypothetical protein [bacterium]
MAHPESAGELVRHRAPVAQVVPTPSSFRPTVPPLSSELSEAATGLRASFQPGVSRFVRARRMVDFDKLWKADPPFAFFVSEVADPGSPPEYRAYLAGCLRKAGKAALPEDKEVMISLLEKTLESQAVECSAKPDLAHTLIIFDEGPETISRLAALSDGSSDDRLRASFLAALSQSRNSKAALLTSACEMSEDPNRWATSLAVIVPPLILSGDALEISTLEKIFTDTQSVELLQRSAQALALLPDAPAKEHLRNLLTARLSQLSHTLNQ